MSLGDQIAPEFTISQGAKIYGISVSTMRRRLAKGQIVGAYKATGPDGSEWRIPLEAIPSNLRGDAWRIVDVEEPFTITDGQIISTLESKIAELELTIKDLTKDLSHAEDMRTAHESEIATLRGTLFLTLNQITKAIETKESQDRRRWFRRTKSTSQDPISGSQTFPMG